MTKLQAINLMLSGIGELAIAELREPYPADIAQAVMILDSVISEVQNTSWHFNTERVTLIQDIKGEVSIPYDAHRVTSDDPECTYIKRGDKLYDNINKTFRIGQDVPVTVIKTLTFDEIPASFQYYITLRAARKFQNNVLGADSLQKFQERDEVEARLVCMKEEQAVTKPNIKGAANILNGWSVAKTLRR